MVASSNASSALAWLVMVTLVVLAAFERRQDVLCRNAVGVAEVFQRLPVGAYGLAARVQREQNLIGVGGGLADPLALAADALGKR